MIFNHFRVIVVIFFVMILSMFLSSQEPTRKQTEWTVMVFLNGDNNLDAEALADFNEMAKIGSKDQVNVVVQFDRCKEGQRTPGSANWSQTLRFHVKKDMEPLPDNAVKDIGEANMGDGKVLADFVQWSMNEYPARRYILILWDHGWGWRDIRGSGFRTTPENPFKAISLDETLPQGKIGDDFLYNREIQENLKAIPGRKKLDIIGMDACLMAMIETAYAFREIAGVMVASQDLELGTGWKYDDILTRLNRRHALTTCQIAGELVLSYRDTYVKYLEPTYYKTSFTLSAIDLSKIQGAARELSGFARTLKDKIKNQYDNIKKARDLSPRYAPQEDYHFYHIDLIRFLEKFSGLTTDNSLKETVNRLIQSLRSVLVGNWANEVSRGKFGSNGLCIYFPTSLTEYREDQKNLAQNGYEKENKHFPVEFVQNEFWCDFLHAYLDYSDNR